MLCGNVLSKMWCRWCRSATIRIQIHNRRKFRGVLSNLSTHLQTPQSTRSSSTLQYTEIRKSFVPFDKFIDEKRNQAKNSILVQVKSDKSFSELHSYCSQFGNILGIHHYTASNAHFLLVEFSNAEEVSNLLCSATFLEDPYLVPVQSPFLWFRPEKSKEKTNVSKLLETTVNLPEDKLKIRNGCNVPSENNIMNILLKSNDVSEQILKLYNATHLNDIGIRLRYIAARQIESSLIGMYPNVAVLPFGSTVNGFGKLGCDLDLVLKFAAENIKDDEKSRLVFQTKKSSMSGRLQHQRFIEIISDLIYHFAPGCSHIRKILQARIPIIKYNHEFTGLECDLSINSLSGLYMSELLYIYGSLDSRVRPLVFTIRKWAQYVGLTNSSPGKWITNFPLTLMVLFFLQNAPNGPLLPSLNYLKKRANKHDLRITDDLIDCTFTRDINNIDFQTNNDSNLEKLLFEFFEFYSTYEFSSNAISINEGKSIKKPDHSAIYIMNPLETNLNVSRNVSFDEIIRMRVELKNAAWYLNAFKGEDVNEKYPWGIGMLFQNDPSLMNDKIVDLTRLVSVKDLFTETSSSTVKSNNSDEEDFEKFNDIMKSESKQPFYKNDTVKSEINNIKKSTSEAIRGTDVFHLDDDKNKHNWNRRKVRRR